MKYIQQTDKKSSSWWEIIFITKIF